jgi:hypothetical protein
VQVVALVIVATGSICVADVVVFPSHWNSCAVCPSCESCNSWSIVNAMRAQLRSVIVATGSICVADVVVFPLCCSFMDATCDLSANDARVFKLIRCLPALGGCVGDKSCWFHDGAACCVCLFG